MQVTNVRVSFLREKQPAQYEKSAPAVEFSAVLADGENHETAARALMISASEVVYNALGYEVPKRVATMLTSGIMPAELSVDTETPEAVEAAPLTAERATVDGSPPPEGETTKKRGRPKGSRNTRPKNGTQAAAEANEMPSDNESKSLPQVSTNPENRVDPDTVEDDEVPGENATPKKETATEFTPKDLHTMIIDLLQATPRRLSVANAKQILAHFRVARAQDLTNEQAIIGKEMVEKMLAAKAVTSEVE